VKVLTIEALKKGALQVNNLENLTAAAENDDKIPQHQLPKIKR
jgi:hypothetical protein